MPDANLTVDGVSYLGWTELEVTRTVEQLAHTWSLQFAENWTRLNQPFPIVEGSACTLKLDTTVVTAGYVDEVEITYDVNEHAMRVSGRSKTGDLCDCAALFHAGRGSWRQATLPQIAADLCQPFGIDVEVNADLGSPFRGFSLSDGETVHEALERACRMRGVLMMTKADGTLLFTRAGTARTNTVIERGVNVVRGGRAGSWKDRHSQYIVKSQAAGDSNFFGIAATQPKRTSEDTVINRYRPLIVQAEGSETGAELQKRAHWERNIRAGRGQRLRYLLKGWTNAEGLWEPNTLVHVVDPSLRVDATLLVAAVHQRKGADGTETDLEIVDPKALSVEPLTVHRRSSFL